MKYLFCQPTSTPKCDPYTPIQAQQLRMAQGTPGRPGCPVYKTGALRPECLSAACSCVWTHVLIFVGLIFPYLENGLNNSSNSTGVTENSSDRHCSSLKEVEEDPCPYG